jgi:Gp157 protein
MSLPHSAYANNLTLVSGAPRISALARKAAAVSEAASEATLKRTVERANTVLDSLEAREAGFASEIKALAKRKAATAKRIARIEDRILGEMENAGLTAVEGVRCAWRSQPAAASALEVLDETLIPLAYMRQPKPPASEPDKVAIKVALAADPTLAPSAWGCRLTTKTSLIRK